MTTYDNFRSIKFLSLSSNLSSNQNYLQEREKKKRKKRESFDRQRGLMEAYPSRYDRSFNFLSGSGANISPPSLSSEGEGISYEVNARKETKILTRFQRWFQPCSRYSSSRALEMELLYESTPYHFI